MSIIVYGVICCSALFPPEFNGPSVAQHFILPFLLLCNAVCQLLPVALLASNGSLAVADVNICFGIRKVRHFIKKIK